MFNAFSHALGYNRKELAALNAVILVAILSSHFAVAQKVMPSVSSPARFGEVSNGRPQVLSPLWNEVTRASERMRFLPGTSGRLPRSASIADGRLQSGKSGSTAIPRTLATEATGMLDPTFNFTGIRREVFPHGDDECWAMDIQQDGKIVCAGNSAIDGENDFSLGRFNTDGSPDITFGNNGKVVVASPGEDSARAVKIQPDGKIITTGISFGSNDTQTVVLLRFNQDGTPDNTFGVGGQVKGIAGAGLAMDLQTDGKILITGFIGNYPGTGTITVLRFNPNGSIDSTFGIQGTAKAVGMTFGWGLSVAIQQDGKIAVAGIDEPSNKSVAAIARFDVNGAPDFSFGTGGLAEIAISDNSYTQTIAIQQDGKIVAGGISYNDQSEVLALARVNANGALDTTFGGTGMISTALPSFLYGLVLQADGKILGTGGQRIERFNVDGSLDPAFGTGGVLTLPDPIDAEAIKVVADGKIVAAGTAQGYDWNFWTARVLSNGLPDNSFNGTGSATIDIGNEFTSANGVVVQPDGKIIAGGGATNGSDDDFTLFRYNADGSRDNSFGTAGKVQTGFRPESWDQISGIALQPDGKIVAAGTTNGGIGVARYDSNGTLDPTFGSGGKVSTDVDEAGGYATSMVLQTDGKIVVAGGSNYGAFVAVRYNPNGTLDTTFSSGGIVLTTFAGYDYAGANSLTIQPDGKIVLAGSTYYLDDFGEYYIPIFSLARYNANGSLDPTFGTNGTVVTAIDGRDYCTSVLLLRDGKILAAGNSLVRYNSNGTLDTSFDGDGKLILQAGIVVNAIRKDSSGKIVVAGYADTGGNNDLAVARLNLDGSFDTSFNGNGKLLFDFVGGRPDSAASIAFDRQGRIILGGYGGGSFAVVRVLGDAAIRHPAKFDFDGVGKTALSVFRPVENNWYLRGSQGGFYALKWGEAGDMMVPADYDGDGTTDVAVYRPSTGTWFIIRSSDGSVSVRSWGTSEDVPVPADYDGDGRDDLAVYRPSNSRWYKILSSRDAIEVSDFGSPGDKPQIGDYDGDGQADLAVMRPGDHTWHVRNTSGGETVLQWGNDGDISVPADYDGDGRTDIAVYRPSTGAWYIAGSATGSYTQSWGEERDIPVPGDYDGDGRADFAVFRPSDSRWYLLKSGGGIALVSFGTAGDVPVPSAFNN